MSNSHNISRTQHTLSYSCEPYPKVIQKDRWMGEWAWPMHYWLLNFSDMPYKAKMCLNMYADSKGSDQPVHLHGPFAILPQPKSSKEY